MSQTNTTAAASSSNGTSNGGGGGGNDNPLKKAKTNAKKNKKFNSILSSLTHSKSSNDVNKSASAAASVVSNTQPQPHNLKLFMNNNNNNSNSNSSTILKPVDKVMTNERSQRSSANPTTKLIKSISNMNIKQHQHDTATDDHNQIRLQYENMPPPATASPAKNNNNNNKTSRIPVSGGKSNSKQPPTESGSSLIPGDGVTNASDANNSSSSNASNQTHHNHSYKLRLPSFKKLRNKFSMKKSHSTTSNLADISKLKESNSTSTNTSTTTNTTTSNANILLFDNMNNSSQPIVVATKSKMKTSFTIDHGIDIIDKRLMASESSMYDSSSSPSAGGGSGGGGGGGGGQFANEYYLVNGSNGTGFRDYPVHGYQLPSENSGFSAIQEEQIIIEQNEKSSDGGLNDDYEMCNGGGGVGDEEDYLSVNNYGGGSGGGGGGSVTTNDGCAGPLGIHQPSNYENCSPSNLYPNSYLNQPGAVQPSSNANSKKSYLNSNGTSSSTLTNNELTPNSTSSPAANNSNKDSGKNKSSTTSKSSTSTGGGGGGISGLFSSLSSSFSLSNHNGGGGGASQVKLRNKQKNLTKIDYQKRISLPASIVNGAHLAEPDGGDGAHDIYENGLDEGDEYYNDDDGRRHQSTSNGGHQRHDEDGGAKKIHFQDKSNIQPAAGNGFVKMNKSSTATSGMSRVAAGSSLNQNRINFKNAKMSSHLPSYQSLSSMTGAIKISESHMSNLGLKPLNRNSRRASMSELGYGKIESYNKLDKLGEGTYATVFKGQSTINNSYVALKEIRLEHEEGAPCTAIREVSLLRQLKHANIVTLHDIIYTEKSLTLVFEYLEKDLKQYMDDCNNIMSLKNVKIFLFQLLRGLAYCHAKQILHRDLKPQNLLINQKGELKLADFGLARAKSIPTKTYSNEVVTLWYRPPDVLLGSTDYSTHIDMWGVGCIFYEMACGKPLFPGTRVDDELYLIFKTLGSPTEESLPGVSTNPEYLALNLPRFPAYDPLNLASIAPRLDADGLSLLGSYLRYNPKTRASASESIRHKFFSTFPEEVYKLENNQSIFELPNITLTRDPGIRLNNAGGPGIRNSSSNFYKF